MNRPDFLGLGAQKAATSWIHACLYDHPQAYLPATKEIHYFSLFFENGDEWYLEHFRSRGSHQTVAGEISPTYLYHPDAAARICRWNREMKLIACLRNPIERAKSAYAYALKQGSRQEVSSLSELFLEKPEILSQGLYHAQLQSYYSRFPEENILVLLYDDIATNPANFMASIYRFLEIDPKFKSRALLNRVNQSLGPPARLDIQQLLRFGARALRSVGFEGIAWKVARSRAGEKLVRLGRRTLQVPQPTPKEWDELTKFYRRDVEALARLLKRDLEALWFSPTAA